MALTWINWRQRYRTRQLDCPRRKEQYVCDQADERKEIEMETIVTLSLVLPRRTAEVDPAVRLHCSSSVARAQGTRQLQLGTQPLRGESDGAGLPGIQLLSFPGSRSGVIPRQVTKVVMRYYPLKPLAKLTRALKLQSRFCPLLASHGCRAAADATV
ncbi:hypothetical protein HDV57DRAFT_37489 [Trichoderma longibrachiatum]|uniref:Uncharacterized protein n=1 Tax=Trichoderma longibrachiatum ATCC 18648 TaxID=983965 RepID=A0A2T4CHL5_TRILO|nr:hypothetical protein M440DRAFT_1006721 [Trichoderma longibrachiatum ATCC 18648]